MTNTEKTQSAASNHDSNASEATMTQPTIQQPPAGSRTTKELRSHPGITIKWSIDSDSLRRIGMPPSAVVGAGAPVASGGAAWR
jgi:hypothetical protein